MYVPYAYVPYATIGVSDASPLVHLAFVLPIIGAENYVSCCHHESAVDEFIIQSKGACPPAHHLLQRLRCLVLQLPVWQRSGTHRLCAEGEQLAHYGTRKRTQTSRHGHGIWRLKRVPASQGVHNSCTERRQTFFQNSGSCGASICSAATGSLACVYRVWYGYECGECVALESSLGK